jgi:hypothetical protein
MKKIQAKKKRDRAIAEAEAATKFTERAPDDGRPIKSMLDDDDDIPVLFT